MQGVDAAAVEIPQILHELPLFLDEILDHLLPVFHPQGLGIGRLFSGALLDVGGGGGRGPVGLSRDLLDVVGREPAGFAVQSALPPAAVLLLGQHDLVALLEVELVVVGPFERVNGL